MTSSTLRLAARLGALLTLAACGHTDPFITPGIDQQGPFSTVPRARLTFNADADLAPSWTVDGKGIIYTFADPSRADHDRCLAILPAAGGTRIWTLCDNRPGHADSAETISSGALDADGELLYLVGSGRAIDQIPPRVTLFHADTATPFNRRALLSLPADVGGGLRPNWLTDINWVGPDEFVAMAADWTVVPQCTGCALRDTVLLPLGVVRGTIGASGASMELIVGTQGASHYSLAEGGNTIVIVNGLTVSKLPRAGGAVTVLTVLPNGLSKRVDDLTCRGTACIVNAFEIFDPPPPGERKPGWVMVRLSTAGGAATPLESTDAGPWSGVRASPVSADVVVRVGSLKTGDLYLFRNLLP